MYIQCLDMQKERQNVNVSGLSRIKLFGTRHFSASLGIVINNVLIVFDKRNGL
jgi:hypothetical protein